MQEEVTQKAIALSMKTGKLTAQVLQMALKKYLEAQKHSPRLHHGRDYEIEVEFNVSFDEF